MFYCIKLYCLKLLVFVWRSNLQYIFTALNFFENDYIASLKVDHCRRFGMMLGAGIWKLLK